MDMKDMKAWRDAQDVLIAMTPQQFRNMRNWRVLGWVAVLGNVAQWLASYIR